MAPEPKGDNKLAKGDDVVRWTANSFQQQTRLDKIVYTHVVEC